MLQLGGLRKYSVDESYEVDQNNTLSLMFPRTGQFHPQEIIDLLKLKFDPLFHRTYMVNACFRSHKPQFVETYLKFCQDTQLKIQEPQISTFYANNCFVSLYDVGRFLDEKTQKYSSVVMDQVPKTLKKLLDCIFIEQGYIPNFQRFLLFYPIYLQKHKALEHELFQENRIDTKIAYFVGLIACAQLGSVYGINRMLNRFCKVGGNIQWVTKKKYPEKIRRLLKLNRKLARSVWEVNSELIEQILEANYWTNDELAIIIQIFVFSHQFATITLAIGLNCEQINNSLIDIKSLIKIKQNYDSVQHESNEGQKLAAIIQMLNRTSSNSDQEEKSEKQKKKQKLDKLQAQNSESRKHLKKSLRRSDNEETIENYMKQIGNQLNKQELYFKFQQVMKPLLPDYHVILKRHDKDHPHLDAADMNFKYTAFPLLYSLTNKAAELTLDLITYSEIMTSNNFGKSKIEGTKPFRKAIRYYTENFCGHFHFEYDYKNIVKYLTMPLKFYIRLLTLSPLHINKQVLKEIRHEQEGQLNLFDLGHVAILVANSKMGLTLTSVMDSFEY